MAIAVVQSVVQTNVSGLPTTTLPAPPTVGNLLVACYYARGGTPSKAAPTPAGLGWTTHPNDASLNGANGFGMYYRRVEAGDTAAFVMRVNTGGAQHSKTILVELSGLAAVHAASAFDVRAPAVGNASFIAGAVTPPASTGQVIVFGGATLSEGDAPQGERAITDATAGFTYLDGAVPGFRRLDGGEQPQTFFSYRILATSDGVTSYTPGGTVSAGADTGATQGAALAFLAGIAAGGSAFFGDGRSGGTW